MFRVTCEPENLDSGNDEHRILRLFDVLNHVVGLIFVKSSEMCLEVSHSPSK